jgi:hypothetical protein
MSEPIGPEKIQGGPIRQKTLPPGLLDLIGQVYDAIGPYLDMNLEQFEVGFMRDTHPEREVAVWCFITRAWFTYHEKYLNNKTVTDELERSMLGALVSISSGVHDVTQLKVASKIGRRLLQCWADVRKA